MTNQNALYKYCLRLGDTCLVLGHRLSEMCSKAPILEEDIALTNIALDYIGQAEALLKYAGEVEGKGRTEDDLAYRRSERQYFNFLLAEQPNLDFGYVIARQFFLSAWFLHIYDALLKSEDETLAGIAGKAKKEAAYHLRHSGEWMVRLGMGTEESKTRIQDAVNNLWRFTGELFENNETETFLSQSGLAIESASVFPKWEALIDQIFERATIQKPKDVYMITGSKEGVHTEHLGHLLADMQYLQRAYPDATW